MTKWDADQYLKFADERTRPAHELLGRVLLQNAEHVVDLGCGPGNSTALLRARWPQARLTGVDSSPEMLRTARRDLPEIEWIEADVGTWQPQQRPDVLYANAVMQWLPDHATLFPRLLGLVREGGMLAVQMPYNFNEPSHRLMRETPGPWSQHIAGVRALTPVAAPDFYYDVLAGYASRIDIWRTTYEHVMPDAAAIVEWVRGTGLRPYLDALHDEEREPYLAAYRSAIDQAYPARRDGKRLFSFPRLFIVATR